MGSRFAIIFASSLVLICSLLALKWMPPQMAMVAIIASAGACFFCWLATRSTLRELVVLRFLTENPGWHYGLDIVRKTGVGRGSIYLALGQLEEDGHIERLGPEFDEVVPVPRPQYRSLYEKRKYESSKEKGAAVQREWWRVRREEQRRQLNERHPVPAQPDDPLLDPLNPLSPFSPYSITRGGSDGQYADRDARHIHSEYSDRCTTGETSDSSSSCDSPSSGGGSGGSGSD